MKHVAQNYRTGELRVLDVPPPACRPGGVLVRTCYSLISTGTEVMKVSEANRSLVGKARARPDQVRKLLDGVAQQGVRSTYAKAVQQLDAYTPLGYSLCGVVVEAGHGAGDLAPGQLVACAGNEFALHAELNWVPRNLCVPVPDGVDPRLAAFATVGAIALHGVRRAEPQLGDTACVVGLGLVGQLVVQLLVASGVQVVGLDVVAERCRLAEKAGAVACAGPDAEGLAEVEEALAGCSGGLGADHVLLVAGGSSNGPVEAAARLARDRARVVDIGKLRLDLPWNAYYDKELDLRFSRSYGPGRYDDRYELEGVDYPAGYVRWTEGRNLRCFLDLLAQGALAVDLLVTETFPVTEAPDVYRRLRRGELPGIGFLFEYPAGDGAPARPTPGGTAGGVTEAGSAATVVAPASDRTAATVPGSAGTMPAPAADQPAAATAARGAGGRKRFRGNVGAGRSVASRRTGGGGRPAAGPVRLGVVGAGNYASSMLLPHLAARPDVELVHVVTNTSLSAANARRRFGFTEASTDVDHLLADDRLDAVLVATRHHSHADLVCRSLAAGKATYVEKPLALHQEELDRVLAAVAATGNDRLMVGFNRRFAPLLTDLRRRFGRSTEGAVVRYLVNAGPLGARSWYRDEALEGSRFTGEGGHFLDTVAWWLDARPVAVHAVAGRHRDDLHVTVRYGDGSVAAVTYATHGHPRVPKELFEVSAGGRTARLDNFRRATLWAGRRRTTRRARGTVDKGQAREMAAFVEAVRHGGPMPIPLPSLASTTAATLAVGRSLATGGPVAL